jgi:hypothetical protein
MRFIAVSAIVLGIAGCAGNSGPTAPAGSVVVYESWDCGALANEKIRLGGSQPAIDQAMNAKNCSAPPPPSVAAEAQMDATVPRNMDEMLPQ